MQQTIRLCIWYKEHLAMHIASIQCSCTRPFFRFSRLAPGLVQCTAPVYPCSHLDVLVLSVALMLQADTDVSQAESTRPTFLQAPEFGHLATLHTADSAIRRPVGHKTRVTHSQVGHLDCAIAVCSPGVSGVQCVVARLRLYFVVVAHHNRWVGARALLAP